jgi:hypothetical protein
VVYSSDTTYFVSGTVYDSSAVTMESAVFKYPTNNIGSIEIANTLTLATTNYRPAVFTAGDDDTVGTSLKGIWSGYTGNPTGKYYGLASLYLDTTANIALNNVRFCYENCAIEIAVDTSSGQTVSLSHSQLVDGVAGIYLSCGASSDSLTLNVDNCLIANVQNSFEYETNYNSINLTGIACNCTFDSCTQLFAAPVHVLEGTFGFTNSIFSQIGSTGFMAYIQWSGGYNAFYSSPAFGSSYTNLGSSLGSSPYVTVGAGNYYLPSTSGLLTYGTTNIPSALLSQLQGKTTQGPLTLTNVYLTNLYTSDTVLTEVAQLDTNGTALGFHYDKIDYIAACSVSNATLSLTNGVVLAYGGKPGVSLLNGSSFISQGLPNQRNYLVYYGLVQEQPTNLSGLSNAIAQSLPICAANDSSIPPSNYMRFTTICAPQGETNLMNTSDSNQVISGLTLRDCEVYGAGANWIMNESNHTPLIGLTNNVFHRVPFAISNNAIITSYNNLFYGTTNVNVTNTTVSIRHLSGTSPNTNENNVFDGVTASLDGLVGYNAYLHGATNIDYTNNNDIWTNLTWLAGPLGAYYQLNTSPLINAGSTTADQVGLYDYTVLTNLVNGLEIKETNSIVDLGYHYVAVNSNGVPIISNDEGIADYLLDVNGNGSGESSWVGPVTIDNPVNGSVIY